MRFKILLVLVALVFCSCHIFTPVDIDTFEDENKMVVYGLFSPDDSIGVYIYRLTNCYDKGYVTVNNATVNLYCNNKHAATLINNGKGYYYSNIVPVFGNEYTIIAGHDTLDQIEATGSLPTDINIDSVSFISRAGVSPWYDNYSQITVSFTDVANEVNYYEILPYTHKKGNYNNYIMFPYSMNDPVLLNSGCIDNSGNFAYFSDDMIDGQTYKMKLHVMDNNNIIKPDYELFIRFMTVSYHMYQYHNKMSNHLSNQGGNGEFLYTKVTNPVTLYTNIKGGYGVFDGYCKHDIRIPIK